MLNLCHHPYVQDIRKYSCAEPHSEPDCYLRSAAAGSPQNCISTPPQPQSTFTLQLGNVEVCTGNMTQES